MVIHDFATQLKCTWEFELAKEHLIFVMLTQMLVDILQIVEGHLKQGKITLTSTFEDS